MFDGETKKPSLTAGIDYIYYKRRQDYPRWLFDLREKGRDHFERVGLPHRSMEEWKYTDLAVLSRHPFSPPAPVETASQQSLKESRFLNPEISPLQMVFVNGFYSSLLSNVKNLPAGYEIGSLAEALRQNHPLLEKHLAGAARQQESSMIALNNAYVEDGAFIYIPPGSRLEEPIHLVYINLEKDIPHALYPRNLIVVDRAAAVSIIEEYIGEDAAAYLANGVTEILVKKGAEVDHYKLQRDSEAAFHIAFIQVNQEADSRFTSHNISFGARLARNNIHSRLSGTGASCTFYGLYLVRGSQHIDNHTLIDHGVPDCRSSEQYHGILDDKARGVFNGKIWVWPDAQRTDAQQTSRSLLLSKDAVVDAKPQLEIFADDVKCSHGATVGQIDRESLYYLRARGITEQEAKKILTTAFARQVSDKIEPGALRRQLESLLEDRLVRPDSDREEQ